MEQLHAKSKHKMEVYSESDCWFKFELSRGSLSRAVLDVRKDAYLQLASVESDEKFVDGESEHGVGFWED